MRMLVGIAVLVGGCGHEEPLYCTQAGCISGAGIGLSLTRPPSELVGGTLRVCMNDRCTLFAIEAGPPPPPGGEPCPRFAVAPGGPNDLPEASPGYCGGPFGVSIDSPVENEPGPFQDGDTFALDLVTATGDTVASHRWDATFRAVMPNGEECGPVCLQTTLDETNARTK